MTLAAATADLPSQHGIEQRGIQRVLPNEQNHTSTRDNFWMWFSANLVISTPVVGALAFFFGLGFWDGLLAILLGNATGTIFVALFSTLGPKTGLRQMVLSRYAFGWNGAKLMAGLNALACLGWSAVNVVLGTSLIVAVLHVQGWVSILLIAGLTTVVSVWGQRYIHLYQRIMWLPMLLFFGYVALVGLPHFNLAAAPSTDPTHNELASWLLLFGAAFGFAIGWSSYAADYNVYMPSGIKGVFRNTYLGVFIPCVILEVLGLLLVTSNVAAWGQGFADGSIGGLLSAVMGNGGIASIVLLLLALSIVANNIPNDYSFGVSMQVFGKWAEAIPRWVWTLVGAVIYVAAAIWFYGPDFGHKVESFLLVIAYWLGPFGAIFALEMYFRNGRYNLNVWDTQHRLPVGWAAVVSWLAGMVGVWLGASQELFTGPLANSLGGADIGFELGIVFAAVAYWFLRQRELASDPARFAGS